MKVKSLPKIIFLIFLIPSISLADVCVRGYTKKDGTYVQPLHRSDPNPTQEDNWPSKENINPYTGKSGTKNIYDNIHNSQDDNYESGQNNN